MQTQGSIKLPVDNVLAKRLESAIVIEVKHPNQGKKAANFIKNSNIPFDCLVSLSHDKILLFFEDELSVNKALKETSLLVKMFPDARRWTGNENILSRLVWVECIGLHPKCWSQDNFRRIGEKWGNVIQIEHDYNGLQSLTAAKLLICTTLL